MKSEVSYWTVGQLRGLYSQIEFPEYQREPTVWAKSAKQRLIDSMARNFSISAIYIYTHADGSMDCVDGRQRLGAIMSFLGQNPNDPDNRFAFASTNEIFDDEDAAYSTLDRLTWDEILSQKSSDDLSARFVSHFIEYQIAVVMLSGSTDEREFHLQFTRLNLGTIVNSGEKLHAMVGEMRDVCFNRLGTHSFLTQANIPTRRYSREQLAAQILAQLFEIESSGQFARTRHLDLQQIFKRHARLTTKQNAIVDKAERIFDNLHNPFQELGPLTNRAMIVSTVLLANAHNVQEDLDIGCQVAAFVSNFTTRLKEQLAKRLVYDVQYRYLIEFQRHVTQASVEKPAVAERARVLEEGFDHWVESGAIIGDEQ